MKYEFEIPAAKYLENDADALERMGEEDIVVVLLDPEAKHAQYAWIDSRKNLGNATWEDDDWEGALEQVLSYFGKVWDGA